jgi:hypothetical protein
MYRRKHQVDQPSQFSYDPRTRRYHDTQSGRFLKGSDVRAAVDTIIDNEAAKVRNLSGQLVAGQINLAEWQIQMASQLKSLHVAMALAANGGIKNSSPGDLGYIGGLVKEQYKFLRDFAKQIKTGEQKLDGTLAARAELYVQASRSTHEKVRERAAKFAGMQEERSLLGIADHCSECLSEAKMGWSPIGSLIPIGERICKSRCHCTFEYK